MTDMMELRHYIDTFSSLYTGKPYFYMPHEPFWRLVEVNEADYGMAAEPNQKGSILPP